MKNSKSGVKMAAKIECSVMTQVQSNYISSPYSHISFSQFSEWRLLPNSWQVETCSLYFAGNAISPISSQESPSEMFAAVSSGCIIVSLNMFPIPWKASGRKIGEGEQFEGRKVWWIWVNISLAEYEGGRFLDIPKMTHHHHHIIMYIHQSDQCCQTHFLFVSYC